MYVLIFWIYFDQLVFMFLINNTLYACWVLLLIEQYYLEKLQRYTASLDTIQKPTNQSLTK